DARKKAAGANDHRVELTHRIGHNRMNGGLRLEPETTDLMATGLPGIDLDFAACNRPIAVLGADRCGLDADGPHLSSASEQHAEAIDRGQKVAGVLLHHR